MVAQSNTTPGSQVHGLLYKRSKEPYMAEHANPRRLSVNQIYDQLELLEEFCREQGFKYDPAECWNIKSYVWQQYQKQQRGKEPTNNWLDQLSRMYGRRSYNEIKN
jgi:hypothetical protein